MDKMCLLTVNTPYDHSLMIIGINVCLSAEQIYIFKNILFTRNTFLKTLHMKENSYKYVNFNQPKTKIILLWFFGVEKSFKKNLN